MQTQDYDMTERVERVETKNGQTTKATRMWQAYHNDEEVLRLKISTWIALVGVVIAVFGFIFGSGVTVSKMVTKSEFKEGLKELKKELKTLVLTNSVSKVEHERMKGQIRLLQHQMQFYAKDRATTQEIRKLLKEIRWIKKKRGQR